VDTRQLGNSVWVPRQRLMKDAFIN